MTGTYQWVVSYSGDANNSPAISAQGGSEPVAVDPASPSLGTTANPSSVTLTGGATTLKDSATLAGGYHETGTLTFRLYAPDGTTVVDTETMAVSGDGTYTTPVGYTLPTSGAVTGMYQWVVSYSGDGSNNPTTRVMGDEPVAIDTARPTLSTSANPSSVTLTSAVATTLKDSAMLSGGYNATGSITFTLYALDGTVVDREIVSVHGDGTYITPNGYTLTASATASGTYQWVATYSGDANNDGVASAPGSEPVSVASVAATTIENLVRLGYHHQPTQIVLTFSGPLDPATANDPANYHLAMLNPHRGRPPFPLRIKGVAYDPYTGTVTIRPLHQLSAFRGYQLTISGVLDAHGNPIAGNGGPGGSYVARFGEQSIHGLPLTRSAAVPRPSIFAAHRRDLMQMGRS